VNTAPAPSTADIAPPSARATFKALYGYVRPHRGTVAFGLLCALVGAAGGLLQPLATKALVDRLTSGQAITVIVLSLTALVLLGTVFEALSGYVLERTAESVVLAARRSLVGRLLRLRIAEVDRIPPGDLMSRVTSDTTLLRAVTTRELVSGATGVVTLVAAVVLMAVLDPVLLGVTLGVLAVVGGAVALVMPRISEVTERSQEAVGEISTELERAFGAYRTVRAAAKAPAAASRRGDLTARRGQRTRGARHRGPGGAGDHCPGGGPPPVHGDRRRPDRGDGSGPRPGRRHPHRTGRAGRALRRAGRDPAADPGPLTRRTGAVPVA